MTTAPAWNFSIFMKSMKSSISAAVREENTKFVFSAFLMVAFTTGDLGKRAV